MTVAENERDALISLFSERGWPVDGQKADQLMTYYRMLVEKNRVMNLTRITNFQDALIKHFADSLMIADHVDLDHVGTVLDLGSGAGFPGVPLRIMYPHLHLVMIDSVGKKMNFVQDVIDELQLAHTEARHVRAEDLARDRKHREQYDLVVSRAVANLSTLAEYCLPFVKTGGCFAAYKADNCEDEVAEAAAAIRKLGGEPADVRKYSFSGLGRAIVLVKKKSATPALYPRKAGTPAKEPLR